MKKLTLDKLEALGADDAFAALMADCLFWQTIAETLREKVDRIHQTILDNLDLRAGGPIAEHLGRVGTRITSPKDLTLAQDGDPLLAEYYRLSDWSNRQQGYDLPKNHCPALVAQCQQSQAEQRLLEYADAQLGTPFAETFLEHREQALKLVGGVAMQNPKTDQLAKDKLPRSQAAVVALINQVAIRPKTEPKPEPQPA